MTQTPNPTPILNPEYIASLSPDAVLALCERLASDRERAESQVRGLVAEIERLHRRDAHFRERPGAPEDQTPRAYVEQRAKAKVAPNLRTARGRPGRLNPSPAPKPEPELINVDEL